MIRPFEGSLFAENFLREAIVELPDWQDLSDARLADLEAALRGLFNRFPTGLSPNESQTEDDLIWPVLARLGWTSSLSQCLHLGAHVVRRFPSRLSHPRTRETGERRHASDHCYQRGEDIGPSGPSHRRRASMSPPKVSRHASKASVHAARRWASGGSPGARAMVRNLFPSASAAPSNASSRSLGLTRLPWPLYHSREAGLSK